MWKHIRYRHDLHVPGNGGREEVPISRWRWNGEVGRVERVGRGELGRVFGTTLWIF